MKLISWNCRGLGKASTRNRLRKLIFQFYPCVLFLQETKCSSSRLSFLCNGGCFDNYFCVEPRGSKGGLCILWKKHVNVNVISSSDYWIDCNISTADKSFYLTAVYGPPKLQQRHILWDHITKTNISDAPWLLCGDFNQIISKQDKLSRCDTSKGAEAFIEVLSSRSLMELPNSGN